MNKKIFALILAFVIIFALTIPISAGQTLYQLVASQDTLFVDGKLFKSGDLPMLNLNGVTYVPLRKICSAFNAKLEYDPETKVLNAVTMTQPASKDTGKTEPTVDEVALNAENTVLVVAYGDENTDVKLRTGSGVVVEGGYIVTNEHVIRDAARYGIEYDDTVAITEYRKSSYIAVDAFRDIAIIASPNASANGVKMGDSRNLKIGQKVVAISSPRGLKNTVTEGVISAFRSIDGINYIQTTAACMPGSSGGGLFNMRGELIGVIARVLPDDKECSFAVPVNEVKYVLDRWETTLNKELYKSMSPYQYMGVDYWFNASCHKDGNGYHVSYTLIDEQECADSFLENCNDTALKDSIVDKLDEAQKKIDEAGYKKYTITVKVMRKFYELKYEDDKLISTTNTMFDN